MIGRVVWMKRLLGKNGIMHNANEVINDRIKFSFKFGI